jgi:hypothetical protein
MGCAEPFDRRGFQSGSFIAEWGNTAKSHMIPNYRILWDTGRLSFKVLWAGLHTAVDHCGECPDTHG